jgi:PAS domain S-box-containing protein
MDERQMKILVVDDNPASRYATARILKSADFQVVEATTGNEAIALAEAGADLVVLDVNLPDMDGFEVCRVLRRQARTALTPILHLSATFVADMDKVRGLESGADGYLTHPMEPPVLIATVNAFLRARAAEEGMRRSEEKYRAIFDQALNGISLISDELVYIDVNPAMCRILGRQREEIVGRPSAQFVPREFGAEIERISRELMAQGNWRGVYPLVRPDGQLVHLDWNISLHSLPGVRLAIVTDITDRVLIEREREGLLASERAARGEAEKANRLKDDFLATLSHELRTPLNAIVGWSHFLQQPAATREDLAEGMAVIERNAKVQTQLIADLLDVSRITSGKMRLDLHSFNPAEVIHAALESIMPAARAKEIKVERNLESDAGPVLADPARVQQVVWNLVSNAVKFTPRGGTIWVELRRIGEQIEVRVSDTGEGMSPSFLPHMFDRFRQADASTRRNQGGLGLGLAIVKNLVEMHGGTVRAESQGEGKGSTFFVTLPVTAKQEPESPLEDAPTAAVKERESWQLPAKGLSGMRILVVDDERDARQLLGRVIADAGAEVMEAASVREALLALDAFRPDVLVSDIGMPVEDGYDLVRKLRLRGHTKDDLPAIALTAFARVEDREKALSSGFSMHLAKPLNVTELLSSIAALAGAKETL